MGEISEILTTMDYGVAPESDEYGRAWAGEQGRQYLSRATQVKTIWTL